MVPMILPIEAARAGAVRLVLVLDGSVKSAPVAPRVAPKGPSWGDLTREVNEPNF
ncbi:hypothetical protein GCM10023176_60330 [Micromonospora coerulea]|uniref:Uncharacterized protein n=2 Tax=Micromonospora TaxID=1873 RepID=A0A1C4VS07_9ACTN|nr:hypothetical protein GA0070607_2563 [Micromonospora coriariae]